MTTLRALGTLAALALAACNATPGSGVSRTESRTVAAFDEVEVSRGVTAVVKVGASGPLQVSGDDNLVAMVTTEVSGGRLKVSLKDGTVIHPKTPLRVEVPAAKIKALAVESGGSLEATGVAAEALSLEASSGGSLKVSGTARSESAQAAAGATIAAGDLAAGSAAVQASSGASVKVRVATTISGAASSGGHVHVLGKPAARSMSESSGGSVDYD